MNIFDKIPQEVKDLYKMSLSEDKQQIHIFSTDGTLVAVPLNSSFEENENSLYFRVNGKYWVSIYKSIRCLSVSLFN